jgi:hypothetical protein
VRTRSDDDDHRRISANKYSNGDIDVDNEYFVEHDCDGNGDGDFNNTVYLNVDDGNGDFNYSVNLDGHGDFN